MATVSRRTALGWLLGAAGMGVLNACSQQQAAAPPKAAAPTPVATTGAAPVQVATPAVAAAKPTEAPAAAAKPTEATKPAAQIKRGGIVRLHRQNDWPTVDPHTAQASNIDITLVYDFLTHVVRDPVKNTWEVKPSLAESWEIPDPSTVIFKLRKGVKFHDGTDCDAAAVKWNLNRMMSHPKSSAKNQVATIDSVEVMDPATLRLKLKSPSPALFVNLSSDSNNVGGIMSPTWAEKVGDAVIAKEAVGTGPFRMTEYLASNQITYKRFDGYWKMGADGKALPYPDEVRVVYNQDWNVALVQLRGGELDLLWNFSGKDVPGIQSNPALEYMQIPWSATMYQISFNAKPGGRFAGDKMKKVRQAFNYALDREGIAKALGQGIGEPNNYYLVPGHIGYSDKVTKYSYDPAKAKQLLTESGFGDGMEVTLDFISRPEDAQNAQLYQQMLGAVGVKVTLQPSERIAWVQKALAGDYEFGTWQSPVRPEPDFMMSNILADNAPSNYMNWQSTEIQQALREARTTYDVAKRQELYEKVQNIMAEEAYIGFVWRRSGVMAWAKTLQGVAPGWTSYLSNSTEMWANR
ncbi:MAG: ABC transporter substrate-binding protein [Chloroflexota bacterium]